MPNLLDWATALELLEKSPTGVLLLRQQTITWVNDALARTLHTSKDLLIGLDAERAAVCGLLPLFEGSERFRLTQTDGSVRWFKRQSQVVGDDEAIFFSDITEMVKLEEQCCQLEQHVLTLGTKDPVTGLLNQTATLQALEQQISRSRRYGNPLAIIRITVIAPNAGAEPQTTLRAIGQEINAQLRWADLIGHWDGNTFLLILPETSLADARRLAGKLIHDRIPMIHAALGWRTQYTCTAWGKGDDSKRLLQRLESAAPAAHLN